MSEKIKENDIVKFGLYQKRKLVERAVGRVLRVNRVTMDIRQLEPGLVEPDGRVWNVRKIFVRRAKI